MRDGEVSADPWNLSSMGSAEASPPRTKRMVMTDTDSTSVNSRGVRKSFPERTGRESERSFRLRHPQCEVADSLESTVVHFLC